MVAFWQLSGPESHFKRNWQFGRELSGNAEIASQVFHSMSRKLEDGGQVVDLVLGIESSGASHILLPEEAGGNLRALGWRQRPSIPYPATKYASLSSMHVGIEKLQTLLDDRQVRSKSTKSKRKGDNSKANQVFSGNDTLRPERAAFEHGRCCWKILHQELIPQTYGLPSALWSGGLDLISLAMNFWSADGSTFLDAGMTLSHLPSGSGANQLQEYTWYFRSRDYDFLQNLPETEKADIPETWNTVQVGSDEKELVGTKIRDILELHSRPNHSPPAPLILLVHNYEVVKDQLESLGIQTSTWKTELKELLGYHVFDQATNRRPSSSPGRQRARSSSPKPRRMESSTRKLSRETPFIHAPLYASVYVVDTVAMFKTVTGIGNNPSTIRPVDVFNKIKCGNEGDASCGGSDSNYIMKSWKTMVAGASIDEQKDFYTDSTMTLTAQLRSVPEASSEAPEHGGLFQAEEPYDIYNDGSDSDDD